VQYSIGSDHTQSLALQRQSAKVDTRLLASDLKHSVLNVLDSNQPKPLAYTPYGHRPSGNDMLSLLGFNGERPDPVTGWYLLGNGFRAYSPVLMRFICPDSANFSPFGKGGLNAYAYCVGDPVNRSDPTGHFGKWFRQLVNRMTRRQSRLRANPSNDVSVQTPARVATPEGRKVLATQLPQLSENAVARPIENMPERALPVPPTPSGNSTTITTTPNRAPSVTVETLISERAFEVRRHREILAHNPNMSYAWRNAQEVYHDNTMNTLREQFINL
jgi:RHS repeat-associated protein